MEAEADNCIDYIKKNIYLTYKQKEFIYSMIEFMHESSFNIINNILIRQYVIWDNPIIMMNIYIFIDDFYIERIIYYDSKDVDVFNKLIKYKIYKYDDSYINKKLIAFIHIYMDTESCYDISIYEENYLINLAKNNYTYDCVRELNMNIRNIKKIFEKINIDDFICLNIIEYYKSHENNFSSKIFSDNDYESNKNIINNAINGNNNVFDSFDFID